MNVLLGRGTGKGASLKHRNTAPDLWCLCKHHWTLDVHTSVLSCPFGAAKYLDQQLSAQLSRASGPQPPSSVMLTHCPWAALSALPYALCSSKRKVQKMLVPACLFRPKQMQILTICRSPWKMNLAFRLLLVPSSCPVGSFPSSATKLIRKQFSWHFFKHQYTGQQRCGKAGRMVSLFNDKMALSE